MIFPMIVLSGKKKPWTRMIYLTALKKVSLKMNLMRRMWKSKMMPMHMQLKHSLVYVRFTWMVFNMMMLEDPL
jgi:hypothetical protein